MTATTALTAQNTQGVSAIHHVPSDFVEKQIDACFNDIGVDVVKIGMLASAGTINTVASTLRRHGSPVIVLDPVMVSTSGAQLLPTDAIVNLCTQMLPLTTILTPNIPEAKLLLENAGLEVPEIKTIDDVVYIAERLASLGPQCILVKGGHLPFTQDGRISTQEADHHTVIDVLYDDNIKHTIIYETDYLPSKNTHGTGCSLACKYRLILSLPPSPRIISSSPPFYSPKTQSLFKSILHSALPPEHKLAHPPMNPSTSLPSSHPPPPTPPTPPLLIPQYQNPQLKTPLAPTAAIACNICRYEIPIWTHAPDAVKSAIRYVEAGIRTSSPLGKGNGPINHFHSLTVKHPGEEGAESSLRWRVYGRK